MTKILSRQFLNIVIPYTTFDTIMEIGGKYSSDALALYCRLLIQVQLQGSTVTRSTATFLQSALGWTESRYKNAKKVLTDGGFIRSVPVKNDDGVIDSWNIEVMSLIEGVEVKNPSGFVEPKQKQEPLNKGKLSRRGNTTHVDSPPGGDLRTNIYKEEDKNNITINNSKEYKNQEYVKSSQELEKVDNANEVLPSSEGGESPKKLSSVIINRVYDRISKEGLPNVSSSDDLTFAYILSKDKAFQKAVEDIGSSEKLVDTIMEYAFSDSFWKGKIVSIKDFRKFWHKMYSHLLVNNKIKKRVEFGSNAELTDLMSIMDKI